MSNYSAFHNQFLCNSLDMPCLLLIDNATVPYAWNATPYAMPPSQTVASSNLKAYRGYFARGVGNDGGWCFKADAPLWGRWISGLLVRSAPRLTKRHISSPILQVVQPSIKKKCSLDIPHQPQHPLKPKKLLFAFVSNSVHPPSANILAFPASFIEPCFAPSAIALSLSSSRCPPSNSVFNSRHV
ncbi:hypothetical protein VKT23_014774 [Stygiomarasmius scandens]|uniref:Uncharacterized protein n=1 Tax=Marasmiellus scandens TaxID=2682957 RepID=A0ABR1IZX9_9AGAR